MDFNDKLTMLVISWDGAEELWKPFSTARKLFWPDCPLKIYLLTQTSTSAEDLFDKVILIPEKYTSNRIKNALSYIYSEYIFIVPDDFFIKEKIDTNKFKENLYEILKQKPDYVTLTSERNNFIFSLTPSIIKKDLLINLTDKFKNVYARNFEIQVNDILRQEKINVKYYMHDFFIHCVLEGYWIWSSYKWCKKNGITLTFKTYHRPNIFHSIYAFFKAFLFNFILKFFPHIYKAYSEKKYCS